MMLSANLLAAMAAAGAAGLVLSSPDAPPAADDRLTDAMRRGERGAPSAEIEEENDMATFESGGTVSAAIASACASLRAGATVQAAFEAQAGHGFASPDLTCDRILSALDRSSSADPRRRRHAAAHQISWACALSRDAGCSPVDALEAVRAECERTADAERARDEALATPRVTVRLLVALPAATLLIGAASHPLRFLLASPAGWLCLCGGVLLQALGMLWTESITDRFMSRTAPTAPRPGRH